MKVSEIFYSIQGEGTHQGMPAVFVRLAGCNLRFPRCSYCDTSYAWNQDDGREMSAKEVINEVIRLSPHYQSWTLLTGGEPLWQEDGLRELVEELKRAGYKIEVETNGSLPKPRWWTLVDSWNADMKCPSSGVCGVSREEWFKVRPWDAVKFVVGTEEDLEFAAKLIERHAVDNPVVLISPTSGKAGSIGGYWNQLWLQEVVEFCLEHQVGFSLQWHKAVYGNRRGV